MSDQQHPQHITGDHISGDKFTGDKVAGNKIETETYIARQVIVQGVKIINLEQLPPEDGEPPYKGLAYFTAADHEWFFGREKMTATLVNRLHDGNFLAVVGDSGSGKSSLVGAGVIPVMTRDKILPDGTVPPLGEWRVETITPTAHPLVKLATALFPNNHAQQAVLQEEALRSNANALHDALAAERKPAGHKLLLFVDQFEELFTLCDNEDERQAFIHNLLTAVDGSDDIKLIITLRADFYAQCLRYEGLRQLLKSSQEPLGAMSAQELAAAILEPAAKGKWQFQAGLVEDILDDVGEEPGRLPLLSHALLETWKRRHGRTLTLSGYEAAGKVKGAIAQTADTVYKALESDEQKIARRIFIRLTELGAGTQDTRRRADRSELGDDAVVQEVIAKLSHPDARLITTSEGSVDVSHEALIREWPLLRGWLDTNRENLLIFRRLTNAAKTWADEGKDPSYLYTGLRLGEAEQWAEDHGEDMSDLEREFLNASLESEKQNQRNRRILQVGGAVIASILVMLMIGSFLINGQRNEAVTARETAVAAKATSDINAELASTESLFAIEAQETAVAAKATSDVNVALAATREKDAYVAETEVLVLKKGIQASQLALASQTEIERDPELALLLATTGLGINNQPNIRTRFYNAIFAPYRHTLNGHTDGVNSAIFSPNGDMILTASNDNTARVWDNQGNEIAPLEGHTDGVNSAIFSPNGDMILTASKDSTAKLWDIQGNEIASLEGHTDWVYSAVFNATGDKLLTASWDGVAKVWNIEGDEIASLEGHTDSVFSAVFNASGNMILTASKDSTAKLWDIQGNEIASLEGHRGTVSSAIFNADGNMVLTASQDGTAKLWDIQGNEIASLEGHVDREWPYILDTTNEYEIGILSAIFNVDEDMILTASMDRTAKLWDIQGNEIASLEGHANIVLSAVFNTDGNMILTSSYDGTAKLWDIQGNEVASLEGHTAHINSAVFDSDGELVLTASFDGTARVWDSQNGETASFEGHTAWVESAIFSPNGDMILTASWDDTAKLWDTQGNEISSLEGHTNNVNSTVFNAEGDMILTTSWDNTAKLWDTQGNEIASLEGHTSSIISAIFSPNGDMILTVSWDNTAKLWDIRGNEIASLEGHTNNVNSAVFNAEGDVILTASDDGLARIWDIEGNEIFSFVGHGAVNSAIFNIKEDMILTGNDNGAAYLWDMQGNEIAPLSGHKGDVFQAVFNSKGDTILTISWDTVKIWDTQGNEITSLDTHTGGFNSSVFNTEGNMILTTGRNGMVKVWDLEGNELASLVGHTGDVRSAIFNSNGELILTAGDDNMAKLWNIYPTLQSKVEVAQERLSRGFTDAECARFFSDDRDSCPQTVEAVFALFDDDLALENE